MTRWEERTILRWTHAIKRREARSCITGQFVPVIEQLHQQLLRPMGVSYLALCALRAIENDPTIRATEKMPPPRDVHQNLGEMTCTFNGSGTKQRDRDVWVYFDSVASQYT